MRLSPQRFMETTAVKANDEWKDVQRKKSTDDQDGDERMTELWSPHKLQVVNVICVKRLELGMIKASPVLRWNIVFLVVQS